MRSNCVKAVIVLLPSCRLILFLHPVLANQGCIFSNIFRTYKSIDISYDIFKLGYAMFEIKYH
jgi:hypothetical protein